MVECNENIMTLLNCRPSPGRDSVRKTPAGTPPRLRAETVPPAEKSPSSMGGKKYLRQYVMTQPRRSKWAQEYVGVEDATLDEVNVTAESETRRRRPADKNDDKDADRRRRAKTLLLAICVVLIAVLAYPLLNLFTSSMLIKEIEVDGNVPYVADDLMAAGDIAVGKGLFSLNIRDTEAKILEKLPYLKTCSVKRVMPDKLVITVTPVEAVIYVSVADEYYALSEDLKVLERSDDPDVFRGRGLIYTDIPDVARSVVGDKLILCGDTDTYYIRDFLSGIGRSELDGRITRLFLEEKFNIVATVDNFWRVKFGSPEESDLKLLTAARIIENDDFAASNGAVIDITVPALACARSERLFDPDARD